MSNGTPPPPPGAGPAAAPAKKKLSPLAWIAIGCGALILVCFLAFLALGAFAVKKGKEFVDEARDNPARTAAEVVVKVNPDLELVDSDEEAGTLTVRQKSTGKEVVFDYDELAEGRFSFTTEEGEYSVDAAGGDQAGVTFSGPEGETRIGRSDGLEGLPDWVPAYPGSPDANLSFQSETGDQQSGAITGTTGDESQEVIAYYDRWFADRGWEVRSRSTNSSAGVTLANIQGSLDGRTVNVTATQEGSATQVLIQYSGPR